MKNTFKISLLFFYFSSFLWTCSRVEVFAQNKNIDSLLTLLKKDKADTNKVKNLNKISWEYINIGLYDTALYFGNQATKLSEKLNFKKGLSSSYGNIGIIFYYQYDFPKALDYYFKALKIDEEIKNKNGIARNLGNIGLVYIDQADYPKALDYYFKALKIHEELKNKIGIENLLGNIGQVYNNKSDYAKALDYFFRALKIAEELKNKKGIAIQLANIGIVYFYQRDYEKALDYYFKALKIDEELKNKNGIAIHLGNIGLVYNDQADYPKALDYYFKALKIHEELKNKNGIAHWLGNIGNVNYRQLDLPKSLDYYFKALKINEELGNKYGIAEGLNNIGIVYTDLKKYKDSYNYTYRALAISANIGAKGLVKTHYETLSYLYEKSNTPLPDSLGDKLLTMEGMRLRSMYYYKRSIAIRDTLFSEENKKELVRKEMNFEFDKKEAITKAENEKQAAVAEEKSRRQKIITWSVALGLFLVIVFSGFIVRSLRITNKQKKIIESQNFQIVESINYSKKIQDSLLPSIDSIRKAIPSIFVFYEPKAIVSGDFYWFKEFEKYTILACVDCTGHGVPGGFMSTLGSLLLDKIANNEALSPSEILNKLSDEIVRVLHQQNGGEIQDGMDLSICLIDRNNKKIEYSGARNGIIVVTNEQAKRYKADPLPVGGNYMKKGIAIERNFKTQHIPINTNDWIYMYTDGFMEQVGGSEGIPMNYTQFENHLLNVSKIENPEEKNKLLQMELDTWRGKHERDDDVLLMGFRVV